MESGLRVIVVDDEEGMRKGIRRILQKQGFYVDTAEDGETALELLGRRTYDLAFVDLKMPGISGFQVTERAVEQCGLIRDRESYLTELQHEKNLSRQLINAMQEGVMVFNIRGKSVLMNPKAEFYLQISFNPDLEAKDLFPQGEILAAVERILSADREARKTLILRSELGGRMLQFRIHPLDRGEEPGGVILLIENVTERSWSAARYAARRCLNWSGTFCT